MSRADWMPRKKSTTATGRAFEKLAADFYSLS